MCDTSDLCIDAVLMSTEKRNDVSAAPNTNVIFALLHIVLAMSLEHNRKNSFINRNQITFTFNCLTDFSVALAYRG